MIHGYPTEVYKDTHPYQMNGRKKYWLMFSTLFRKVKKREEDYRKGGEEKKKMLKRMTQITYN